MQTSKRYSTSSISTMLVAALATAAGCAQDHASLVGATSVDNQPAISVAKAKPGLAAVKLRSAGNYVILSKAGISTTGTTSIVISKFTRCQQISGCPSTKSPEKDESWSTIGALPSPTTNRCLPAAYH